VATIKRHLLRKKRLTGNSLEFALTVASEDSAIGEKLKAGRVLTRLPQDAVPHPLRRLRVTLFGAATRRSSARTT
jgi:hypothetical protein